MRTPIWEQSPGALAALLNGRGPLLKADLYTVTLASGAVYRWSGCDVPVNGGGNTWLLGPGIKRGGVRFTVGLEVDRLQLTLTDVSGTTISGQPLIGYIAAGGWRGARVQLDRAFAGVDGLWVGALAWFQGRVADIRSDRYSAEITVNSDVELLDVQVPPDLYQSGCLNTLFDARCGANRAAVTVTGTATSATDARRITFSHGLPHTAGRFNLGVITMTGGSNSGIRRTVKLHTSGQLTVLQPWGLAVASGDTFSIEPGCTKALYLADGTTRDPNGCWKFHTDADVARRFRGQPWIPVPETVT